MASYLVGCMIAYFTGRSNESNHAAPSTISEANDSPASSRPCRFRLDTSTSSTFSLPNGRKIGYAEYGHVPASSAKHTVFSLHGIPGSRLEGAFVDEIAKKLSIRIIVPERPGIGLSDPNPGWTPLSHAQDVLSLATHLGIQQYGVMGTSGGGPYALACAYLHPAEKLQAVSVVTGMGDLPSMGYAGMAPMHKLGYSFGFRLGRATSHWPVTWLYRAMDITARTEVPDDERLQTMLKQLNDAAKAGALHRREIEFWSTKDEAFKEDLFRVTLRSNREMWDIGARGYQAFTLDGANISSPWEFRVQDIRPELPMLLWYGKFDSNVSGSHGVKLEERLSLRGEGAGKKMVKLHLEDETHNSLQFTWQKEIWEELVQVMDR